MKPLALITIALLTVIGAVGQNIVFNGSFEEFPEICCDSANGQMCASPWSASNGSPDHFRSCGEGLFTVPLNFGGHQFPRTGGTYGGLVTVALPTLENHREILVQTMKYDLSAGEEYYFECWVSPFDNLRRICHNIGITFTEYQQQLGCIVGCPIYLENDSSNPLDDKEIWTKVSGTFISNGGERKIHIGNFRPDSLSEMEWVDDGSTDSLDWWDLPYYYIDDVWLSHIDSAGYVNITEPQPVPITITNPVRSTLQISHTRPLALHLFDLSGRAMLTEKLQGGHSQVSVSHLQAGIYVAVFTNNKGVRHTEKVVVQH